jgi:hypothetical protein
LKKWNQEGQREISGKERCKCTTKEDGKNWSQRRYEGNRDKGKEAESDTNEQPN